MRLSQIGHSSRCSFCHRDIEGAPAVKNEEARLHLGGYARRGDSGPGVLLCVPCAESGVVMELQADAIADSALLVDREGKHTRAMAAEPALNTLIAKYRATIALRLREDEERRKLEGR